jgi:hypothetical protein
MMRPLELLRGWVLRQARENAGGQADWFGDTLDALAAGAAERELHIVLGLAPRRLGKADLALTAADEAAAEAAHPGWRPKGWSIDGAARVAALLAYRGKRPFAETFKDLRRTSDVAEMIALYRGLPLYPEPESLSFEVGEGLRSNIRAVFEAIAHDNPYPRDRFDEHRWNHMVLKALFVGSRLAPIIGLDQRANPELARILRDFAHERWAAGRKVPVELWRCVGPFATDEAALDDLRRALAGDMAERAAAVLALIASHANGAAAVLAAVPELARAAAEGALSWDALPVEETA